MTSISHVIPKNVEDHSQLRVECTRKINRLWSRLFWVYGLQLHHDDEEHYFPKWKKFVFVLLPRLYALLLTLRYIILIIMLPTYEVFVMYFPSTISSTLSILTAVYLLKREAEFSALYKIVLELALKNSDDIRKMERYIYIVLFIFTIFIVALFIFILIFIPKLDSFMIYNFLVYTQFNHYLSVVYVLFESIFNMIFSHLFLDIIILYFSYMCKVLTVGFHNLNEDVERTTSAVTNAKLNAFRRRYKYLSHLAEKISENFSPLLLFWLVGLIVILCITIRSTKQVSDIVIILYYLFDGGHLVYLIVLIFKNSSEMLLQIRKLKGNISEILIAIEDEAETHQVRVSLNGLLFIQSLNDDTVGISVSGLFLLSTVSFLNMASTVMTYVVLVYQS
uniref:Gustatory receptor n=1 Tax=Strigamia maritima TaxID=126957 RepID=T1JM62_STRMM